MKTVIVGVGNPILTDDSVGIKVAQSIKNILRDNDVDVLELCAGGVRLMEALVGYEKAIIIDSIVTGNGKPGTVYSLTPSDIAMSRHISCAHDTDLSGALELGKMVGLELPSDIKIWAIEVENTNTVSEELTDSVEKSALLVVNKIVAELQNEKRDPDSCIAEGTVHIAT